MDSFPEGWPDAQSFRNKGELGHPLDAGSEKKRVFKILNNPLKLGQITVNLELADVGPVGVPFDLLVINEFVEDVVSQDLSHQLALLRFQDGRVKIPWQIRNAMSPALSRVHLVNVLFNRILQVHLLLYAVHARAQHHGKSEIGIAGRVR